MADRLAWRPVSSLVPGTNNKSGIQRGNTESTMLLAAI